MADSAADANKSALGSSTDASDISRVAGFALGSEVLRDSTCLPQEWIQMETNGNRGILPSSPAAATQASDTPTREFTPIPRCSTPSPKASVNNQGDESPTTTEDAFPVKNTPTHLVDNVAEPAARQSAMPELIIANDYDGYFEELVRSLIGSKHEQGMSFNHRKIVVTAGPFRMYDWNPTEKEDMLEIDFYSPCRRTGGPAKKNAILRLL